MNKTVKNLGKIFLGALAVVGTVLVEVSNEKEKQKSSLGTIRIDWFDWNRFVGKKCTIKIDPRTWKMEGRIDEGFVYWSISNRFIPTDDLRLLCPVEMRAEGVVANHGTMNLTVITRNGARFTGTVLVERD